MSNNEEHVDHIDNNKMNDDINNLQILSIKENNVKAAKIKGKRIIVLKCPNCGKIFEKSKRETHLVKSGKYTGCSRKCSSTFGTLIQHNPNDERIKKAIKENIIKEYIKYD